MIIFNGAEINTLEELTSAIENLELDSQSVLMSLFLQEQAKIRTPLQLLEDKSNEYLVFGNTLYSEIKRKVWAQNTLLISQGNTFSTDDMKSLLATSDLLQKSLESGSLLTAKDICSSLKTVLPIYADIADFAIIEINKFMRIVYGN